MIQLSWESPKVGRLGGRGAGDVAGRPWGQAAHLLPQPQKGALTANPGLEVRKRRLLRKAEEKREVGKTRTLSPGASQWSQGGVCTSPMTLPPSLPPLCPSSQMV